jgi:predicted nucleic acid-binding protein
MKDLFPGFLRKTEENINVLWENALICFDTNVLLDLYRYSDETRTILLQLLTGLQERVMLPRQVVWEYQRRRLDIIAQQYDPYDSINKDIQLFLGKIKNDSTHPFFSEKLVKVASELAELVNEESENAKNNIDSQLKVDPIFEQLGGIFEGRVGGALDSKIDIEKVGLDRYKHKIPPGYMDSKKEDNMYGDLIVWFQLIEISKQANKPIILVTNDQKEDWWWILKGDRKIGPRPELVFEMLKESNQEFHIYTTLSFMKFGNTFLRRDTIAEKVLNEVKEVNNPSSQEDVMNAMRLVGKMRTYINLEKESGELTVEQQEELKKIRSDVESLLELVRNSPAKGNSQFIKSILKPIFGE